MKTLNEIPGKSPFRVPDNYFDDVNRRIIDSTIGEGAIEEKSPDKRSLYIRFRPYLLAAASIAAFVVISYTGAKIIFPTAKNTGIAAISIDELSASAFNDIDITTLEENAAQKTFSDEMPQLSKPELIDYLLSENIDVNDIYEIF